MIIGVLLSIDLFYFAWTSWPRIIWFPEVLRGHPRRPLSCLPYSFNRKKASSIYCWCVFRYIRQYHCSGFLCSRFSPSLVSSYGRELDNQYTGFLCCCVHPYSDFCFVFSVPGSGHGQGHVQSGGRTLQPKGSNNHYKLHWTREAEASICSCI